MSIAGAVMMIACGVGAVVGLGQWKAGVSWGRPVALGCAALARVLAAWGMLPKGADPVENATRYSHASGVAMGQHLADRHSGSQVLILLPPASDQSRMTDMQAALLDGFKEELGRDLELVGEVPLEPPEALKTGQPPAYEIIGLDGWFTTQLLVEFLEAHKGTFDILVPVVPLPGDFTSSPIDRYPGLPDIAIFHAPIFGSKEMIQAGVIDAMVIRNPDPDTASAQAPLLVTPENIQTLAATYPSLF